MSIHNTYRGRPIDSLTLKLWNCDVAVIAPSEFQMATKQIETQTPDLSKLSFAEQVELLKQLNASVAANKAATLKTMVEEFKTKFESNGFTVLEVVTELRGFYPNAQAQSEAPKAKRGQSYKHPTTGEVWTKNEAGKGKDVAWLQGFIAQGRKYEEFECETPAAK